MAASPVNHNTRVNNYILVHMTFGSFPDNVLFLYHSDGGPITGHTYS